MKYFDVTRAYDAPFQLPELKAGMCLVLYTDKGPSGPCGQSMNITCPHACLTIFPSEEIARQELAQRPFRRGARADVRLFVVGEYGDGQLSIGVFEE